MKIKCRYQFAGIALAIFLFCHTSVRANVYATDIRVNGSQNAGVVVPGAPAAISYILNDEASAGVTVRVWSGTNPVHTFTAPGGSPGTQLGLNTVAWGGTNDLTGTRVQPGVYTVSITAASEGYEAWTNIIDYSTNGDAPGLTGIDVNRNTNSPYYGRVFVGCAIPAYTILKCNADGSPADEGGSSNGGLSWGAGTGLGGEYFSPWKIAIGANDKVYINDYSGFGVVYAFDELISTNYQEALGATNYPYWNPQLSGLYITGSATNSEIWMTDNNPVGPYGNTNPPAGILRWQLGTDGTVATNDTGTVIAPVTNTSPLSWAPYDVAIDSSGYIYTIQLVTSSSNLGIVPIICFSPYAGSPETNALWTAGAGDTNLIYSYGIAVDQTATFVAVAVRSPGDPETGTTGLLNLYYATNGQFFANLDKTGGDQYMDVAWDNIGNLYALDLNAEAWRVYSPPGSNQATTVAVPFIQAYNALTPPSLLSPNLSALGLNFTLQGQSNVTYFIEQSPDMVNWTAVATNYSPATNRPISIPFADNQDFYRAAASP
jgi:hypothetical protein